MEIAEAVTPTVLSEVPKPHQPGGFPHGSQNHAARRDRRHPDHHARDAADEHLRRRQHDRRVHPHRHGRRGHARRQVVRHGQGAGRRPAARALDRDRRGRRPGRTERRADLRRPHRGPAGPRRRLTLPGSGGGPPARGREVHLKMAGARRQTA
jgi:hypothetical protein